MNVDLRTLSLSTILLISLTTSLPLTINPLPISQVLAQAPTPTPEEQIRDGVYLNQQGLSE